MPVPNTFGTATSAIPLSDLDDNFAAPITIGNTAVQLGNTVTTLNNMTLANVTISSGNVTITNVGITNANVSGTANISTLVVVGNATVGGNITAANANVTTNLVLSNGTANGVAYLNVAKVLTTGSALTYDGTKLTSSASGAISGVFNRTTSSGATLDIQLSSSNIGTLGSDTGGNSVFDIAATNSMYLRATGTGSIMTFSANNAEYMRIASATGGVGAVGIGYTSLTSVGNNGLAVLGNVGIGTASPGFKLEVNGGDAAVINTNGRVYIQNGNTSDGAKIAVRGATATSNGYLAFEGYSLEYGRFDASGNLLVGDTTNVQGGANNFSVFSSNLSAKYGMALCTTQTTGTGNFEQFVYNGTAVGSISSTGTITVYATTSDYRLKTVVGSVTGHGERIDALEPVEYTWNSTGSRTRGFLAHKFQEVYADSVTGEKDAVDENGNPVYQSMQAGTAEVIADLVAEIQSLRKRLAAANL